MTQVWGPEFNPQDHRVEGENTLLQLPFDCNTVDTCMCTHIHTTNTCKNKKKPHLMIRLNNISRIVFDIAYYCIEYHVRLCSHFLIG